MDKINFKFWFWYDNMKEPYRIFFMFLVLFLPYYVALFFDSYRSLILIYIPVLSGRMYYIYQKAKFDSNVDN